MTRDPSHMILLLVLLLLLLSLLLFLVLLFLADHRATRSPLPKTYKICVTTVLLCLYCFVWLYLKIVIVVVDDGVADINLSLY